MTKSSSSQYLFSTNWLTKKSWNGGSFTGPDVWNEVPLLPFSSEKNGLWQKLHTNFYQCTIESVPSCGCALLVQLHLRREGRPATSHQSCTKHHRCSSSTLTGRETKIRLHWTMSSWQLPLCQAQHHEDMDRMTEKHLLRAVKALLEAGAFHCIPHLMHFMFMGMVSLLLDFYPYSLIFFILLKYNCCCVQDCFKKRNCCIEKK